MNSKHSRIRGALALLAMALAGSCIFAGAAQAAFGIHDFDVSITDAEGRAQLTAGVHPDAVTVSFAANTIEEGGEELIDDVVKDLFVTPFAGFTGDQTAVPRCSTLDFLTNGKSNDTGCSDDTAIGIAHVELAQGLKGKGVLPQDAPLYFLEPAPGTAARLGFSVLEVPVTASVTVSPEPPYRLVNPATNISQVLEFYAAEITLWGVPGAKSHDEERGSCYQGGESCPSSLGANPFLTMPRACAGPQRTDYATDSWQNPGARLADGRPNLLDPNWATGSDETSNDGGEPQGFLGCGDLSYSPRISSEPTSRSAESGAGLDFDIHFDDPGLKNPVGRAASETKKAVVTLPRGVTINPSVGEGLATCTPAQLERETASSVPGEGCPEAAKVGSLTAEFPVVEQPIEGAIYLAQQDDPATSELGAENPFDALIAAYFVLRNAELGVIAKLPVLIEPDPRTGQLVVTLDNSPQFPLSHFNAHLRTGERAALVTPGACGAYTTEAKLYPWSDPTVPTVTTASFEIDSGVRGGPCPPGGVPPFHPGFEAGSLNNNAGSFSPFVMRLLREDGEQDMTKFSAKLPPGVLGSLAGVSKCPDVAVPAARSKTGRTELALPSCPANSLIGRTLAGAGVGSALTYVGGNLYLAGPYNGAPLSVIAITPAVAGPFDAGTVVVRLALTLNPKTAEVEVDGAASDPIPHILKGIVLKLRDLRVSVDRPNFTLNPTSCAEGQTKATLFGSFLDVLSPADDVPVGLASRFQAASCQSLGFKPKLGLKLKGGTRRGGHPGLRAIYTPRKGDANIEGLVVRLPRSAFLDQAHIRTICTRVQFAADACPKAAQYGYIRAWTPLLDEPLQGPVWLRSSNHKLPDLVFDLKGLVDIEVAVRIDSAKGGIRATMTDAPDAPLSRVVLNMQGGKKGLIINSRNLCTKKSRANIRGTGHNGKRHTANPVMRPQCKRRKAKRSGHRPVG